MIHIQQPAKKAKRWSAEDLAVLERAAAGDSIAVLAKTLGRSRSSVESKAKELVWSLRQGPATIAKARQRGASATPQSRRNVLADGELRGKI